MTGIQGGLPWSQTSKKKHQSLHMAGAFFVIQSNYLAEFNWREREVLAISETVQDYYCAKSVFIFWNKGGGLGD